jgi:hypothetical protein
MSSLRTRRVGLSCTAASRSLASASCRPKVSPAGDSRCTVNTSRTIYSVPSSGCNTTCTVTPLHAKQLAPQLIYNDLFVREAISGLLRQARRDAGGRELRGLAWRMRVAYLG